MIRYEVTKVIKPKMNKRVLKLKTAFQLKYYLLQVCCNFNAALMWWILITGDVSQRLHKIETDWYIFYISKKEV